MLSSWLLVVDDSTIHGLLWLIDASLQSLPLLSHGVLLVCHFCLCVFTWYSLYASVSKFPLLYKVTSKWISPPLHFNLITSVKTLFPKKVIFAGVRD